MKNVILHTETELIQQCLRGERQAQFLLYQHYAKPMLNVAFRILNHEEDAKDVLQESFIKAFRNLAELKDHNGFGGWLKKIVVNTAINHLRQKKVSWLAFDPQIKIQETAEIESSENVAINLKKARAALLELPDGYRTVLTLYLIEGYDHQEISEILGIAVSTSLTQFKRGKEKLKALIKKMNYDG